MQGGKEGGTQGDNLVERAGRFNLSYIPKHFFVFPGHLGENDESSSVGKIVHDIEGKKASMVKPCFISSKGEEKRLRQVMMDH